MRKKKNKMLIFTLFPLIPNLASRYGNRSKIIFAIRPPRNVQQYYTYLVDNYTTYHM